MKLGAESMHFNPAGSVFCAHGAGFAVKWDQVPEYMHLPSFLEKKREEAAPAAPAAPAVSRYAGSLEEDKELMAIYERTYGPIRRRDFESRAKKAPEKPAQQPEEEKPAVRQTLSGPGLARREEYLLVDGYNIIFAWDELKTIAQKSMDTARQILMDILSNYQGYRGNHVILVFDAYKVPGNLGSVSRYHNIHVVYTKETETADSYIEKTTYSIARHHKVQVATSDNLEQVIILGHGALRISAPNCAPRWDKWSSRSTRFWRKATGARTRPWAMPWTRLGKNRRNRKSRLCRRLFRLQFKIFLGKLLLGRVCRGPGDAAQGIIAIMAAAEIKIHRTFQAAKHQPVIQIGGVLAKSAAALDLRVKEHRLFLLPVCVILPCLFLIIPACAGYDNVFFPIFPVSGR